MSNTAFEDYIKGKIYADKWENDMREFAKTHNVPILRPLTENFLKNIIGMVKPVNVLEIGTAIGFSSVVMYKKMLEHTSNPHILTIEKVEPTYEIAKEEIAKLNYDIDIVLGDAGEIIKELKVRYDLIFLDGPKAQYIRYLPYLLKIMHKDSILFVDNISHNGDIAKDRFDVRRRDRTIHTRLREFIDAISCDENLDTCLLDVEDGIAICRKKNDE